MRRIGLAFAAVLGGLAGPGPVAAQPTGRIVRIGYLVLGRGPIDPDFLNALRELGYVEGRSVVIQPRFAESRPERLPTLAAELVELKPDLIVAPSTAAAMAAAEATKSVPIVSVTIPVPSELATSLARPGGNVTGLAFFSPELVGKCLEQLKLAVPRVSRVAALWQPGGNADTAEAAMLERVSVAARELGVRLHRIEARRPEDLEKAFAEMARTRVDGLTVLPSNMFVNERARLVDLAARSRLPAVYPWKEFVENGGLLSYGLKIPDLFRRAAVYVDRILKGAKPDDLPIEQPTKFELAVNARTARSLRLTIPPSVLARADVVIEK